MVFLLAFWPFEQVELIRRDYVANGGWETFLSYEDPEQDILIGLLRLRKCSEETFRPELKGGVSIVRELHVYGSVVPVSSRDPSKFQHQVSMTTSCVYGLLSSTTCNSCSNHHLCLRTFTLFEWTPLFLIATGFFLVNPLPVLCLVLDFRLFYKFGTFLRFE